MSRGITAFLSLLGIVSAAAGPASAQGKPAYTADYYVTVSADDPTKARVRWELSGIDEIKDFDLELRSPAVSKLRASGTIERTGNRIHWVPGGPYAHMSYTIDINHPRGDKGGFDSYATAGWLVTRGRQLFPKIGTNFVSRAKEARGRGRLILRLPAGWRSATPHPWVEGHTYDLRDDSNLLPRPRGWLVAGGFDLAREEIADIMVQIAAVPGSRLPADDVFALLNSTLPRLKKLLQASPPKLLIANAPDPMWRGGLSGEASLYLHGDRPLRTPDRTSPHLHELFHVLQPFRAGRDADWIIEGLAEYYSLELQRRAGMLDASGFLRGLKSFERHGLWGVDLATQHDNAATNNSAPLVMYALDQRVQHATSGKRKLDDVVGTLARERGVVDGARFRRTVQAVSGKKLTKFFTQHVTNGVPPKLHEVP